MNRRQFLSTCGAVTAASSAGCTLAPDTGSVTDTTASTESSDGDSSDWRMFRFNETNTGFNRDADGPDRAPSLKWTHDTGDDVWGSPVVADGVVYIGSYDGYLYALSAEDGEEIWRFQTGDRIDGSPAIVDGVVYFGSFDKTIYAVDSGSGEERWSKSTGGIVRSSPTIVDGTVYIGSHCRNTECAKYYDEDFEKVGYLYALDAETGDEQWSYETGDEILSSPAVHSGNVYIGCSDRKVYAVEASSGEKRWDYETDGRIFNSPAVSDGDLYIGSNDNTVYSLDAETGEENWSFETDVKILTGSPTVSDEAVYICGGGRWDEETREKVSEIYRISKTQGEQEWSRQVTGQLIGGSPALADGILYIGSHNIDETDDAEPGIFAFTTDGEEHWSYTEGDSSRYFGKWGFGSSPTVVDGSLYVGGTDNLVYAFG